MRGKDDAVLAFEFQHVLMNDTIVLSIRQLEIVFTSTADRRLIVGGDEPINYRQHIRQSSSHFT